MTIENLDVQEKVKETESNWEKGYWEGINAVGKPLPLFVTKKYALMWTAYERGYWFGREMSLIERNLERESY